MIARLKFCLGAAGLIVCLLLLVAVAIIRVPFVLVSDFAGMLVALVDALLGLIADTGDRVADWGDGL